jgi:ABC-type multidrug transport system fused ATPase/permease subunit
VVNLSSKLESVFDFLNRSDKPYLHNGTIPMGQLQTGIRFKNVSFRYDNAEQDVLQDLTFEIPKNKMTAIVGTSGAGKSSIVNLIARLYDCSSGEILIDNKNIKAYQIESWRQSMAVVSQDTFIFNESVLTNIRFAKLDATLEEVIEAAKLAQAHEFIEALPQQYDTLLGDRGVRLSGGQQRRITIARAIVVLPQLLIFDEATSDLDSETEQALQEAIGQFRGNRTMLVIAHRLSTIRDADNILVLEAGRIVEQGNHQVLIQNNRLYKRLVEKQNLISID